MAIKILVTAIGQHIIADVKQVENAETGDRVAYWVEQPRLIGYNRGEDGTCSVSFLPYCFASNENNFSIRDDHIVSVLEPMPDIAEHWRTKVYEDPKVTITAKTDDDTTDADDTEDWTDPDQ